MITLNNIIAGYGDKVVLDDITASLDPSKITVIMGPNGCGKTTLLKTIMGLIKPMSGRVCYVGAHDCAQHHAPLQPSPRAWIRYGVFMIGQGQRVFPNMSVRDNLEIMTHWWGKVGRVCPQTRQQDDLGTRSPHQTFQHGLEEVLMYFPDLRSRLDDMAGNLSGGQQQMVALARGLINRPRCLLLDEPSIGLAPKLISDTFHKLHEINRATGTGFIIVEHNLKTLLPLTDNAIILAHGKVAYDGPSDGKTLGKMLDKIF